MGPISGRFIKKLIAATEKRIRFRVRFLDSILGPILHTAARGFEDRPHDAQCSNSHLRAARKWDSFSDTNDRQICKAASRLYPRAESLTPRVRFGPHDPSFSRAEHQQLATAALYHFGDDFPALFLKPKANTGAASFGWWV